MIRVAAEQTPVRSRHSSKFHHTAPEMSCLIHCGLSFHCTHPRMKSDSSIEKPPSYVESVGPSRNARSEQSRPGQETASAQGIQQQNGQTTSSPMSPGRASTSSDSSSTHGSFALWGRKKGKEKERVQEKEDTSAERKEYERRQRKEGASVEAATSSYISHIPPEAQKALAPLTVSTDSKDIVGTYSIELSTNIAYAQAANGTTAVLPTCRFSSSTKNDIDVTLYFRPPPPPPADNGRPPLPPRAQNDVPLEILANSKKGKIKLTVPHRLPGRPLRVICSLDCKLEMLNLKIDMRVNVFRL